MNRFIKVLAGLLLLPACWGLGQSVASCLAQGGHETRVWVPLIAGGACWLVIYWLLPKPMWTYVLGHELTHAVWAWLFGARVKRLSVTGKGGHVIVSKTNVLITLAPYFFPLYAVLIALAYGMASWWIDPQVIRPWFHLFYGGAYAFHFTMTADVLRTRQPDLVEHGTFFSAVVIWIGNAVMILVTLALLLDGLRPWDVLAQSAAKCAAAYTAVCRAVFTQ